MHTIRLINIKTTKMILFIDLTLHIFCRIWTLMTTKIINHVTSTNFGIKNETEKKE